MRGVSKGSSLLLYSPKNAVESPTTSIVMKQGTPTVTAEIEGVRRDLILDTGSNILILQPGVSQSDIRCTSIKPYGETGETLEIRGQQTVSSCSTITWSNTRFTYARFPLTPLVW